MPSRHANISHISPDASRRGGTEPPGRGDDDPPNEDELFAIWVARLL